MDKYAIRTYAMETRRNLMEAVRQKAYSLYIHENGALPPEVALNRLRGDGIFLSPEQVNARLRFCDELAALGQTLGHKTAYQHLIEEVAYTWFNRLIALRFMEVNEYLPSGVRILSSREPGRIEPDAVREAGDLSGSRLTFINQTKIAELRTDTGFIATEKLYRYILIAQCNALADILPGMFQKANDYTELLLPDALLAKGGIVYDLVNKIPEDNFDLKKQGQIEIIGWLYQYYISEKKDEVFANLKKNIKINRDTIPAATQLFTPEWIVKYMVENSLGRLWLESHPSDALRATWKYFVDEAEQEPAVADELHRLRAQSPVKCPEDIKLIDPCMGSGHILVYAFDVLHQIYQSEGYAERDIPNLILQNNLYGLDIDDRAGQLAYFALMMKARGYNRRFFRQACIPQPMVYSPHGDSELAEYGSLITVDEAGDKPELPEELTLFDFDYEKTLNTWNFRRLLAQKYDVVVTNPPYMGSIGMNNSLSSWLSDNYTVGKGDLSTAFMLRTMELCAWHGIMSMINIPVWMSKSTYESLRKEFLTKFTFCNMLHFGRGIFGSDFGTVAFTIYRNHYSNFVGVYHQLFEQLGAVDHIDTKEKWFFERKNLFQIKQDYFLSISSYPIAYWESQSVLSILKNEKPLSDYADARKGLTTGDNDTFVRLWHEVSQSKFTVFNPNTKWYPMTKGGEFRRWYGNNEYVVNWENDGFEIKNFKDENGKLRSVPRNTKYYLQECISWNDTTATGKIAFRYQKPGFVPNASGPCVYCANGKLNYYFGLLNSCVSQRLLFVLAPNMKFEVGQMALVPIIEQAKADYEEPVRLCVASAKTDWDAFETSWDFKQHPLIVFKCNGEESQAEMLADDWVEGVVVTGWSKAPSPISQAFDAWARHCDWQFDTLKKNEEALNRIFIDIYGLQGELTPEVDDKDITVRRADLGRDIRSLISYAVGCMFGRYSLDVEGLAFAGGEFDMTKYKTFMPEDDNIIPIGSADYFDDDIVVRFTEFIRTVYGDSTLGENLNFIADALYPNSNGTAQERIRRYFLNDFYKDHVRIYQKRPIYWLMNSGKKDGFKALFYLHRYDKYTIARARTDYLHPLQRKYDAEVKRLEMLSAQTENAREKAAFRKEIDVILAKMDECRAYDQVVSHIAHQQIAFDLDDGVRVNYARFQGVEVPRDNGRTETMDLLGRF